jgi:hypothetical protein
MPAALLERTTAVRSSLISAQSDALALLELGASAVSQLSGALGVAAGAADQVW